jgi:predicted AAA+ superfamily ATPase
MEYPRSITSKLKELSRYFPAIAISGARQSGKTFLVRKTFPDYNFVSLDLPSVAEQAEKNTVEFLKEHPTPVIIDEVQYAPGLFRHLKAEIDRNRHAMGRYILTGSQQFVLMKGISDSLAGRCAVLELENLSRDEVNAVFPIAKGPKALLSFVTRGQFPELWRVPDFPGRDFYAAYLATYLERDVRQILNVTSLRDFERFIRMLAARTGSMLNKSDIARDVGVSVVTIGDWLSVLQASGQIILLEPWYSSFGKRMVKSPKVYFRDTGLLCFLLNLDETALAASPYLGALWETLVFAEMRKLNHVLSRQVNFWYYRDQRAREIDFILELGGKLIFLECKWRENPDVPDARHLLAVRSDLVESRSTWRAGDCWIIGTTAPSHSIGKNCIAGGLQDLPRIPGE